MNRKMSPDEIGKQYDLTVQAFEQARSASYGLDYLQRFIALLPPRPRVLEIGCGTGVPLSRQLVASGAGLFAIDISEKMLEIARANVPAAGYLRANIVDWAGNGRYDGIFAWDSLFHIPLERQRQTVHKALNWLRPGGVAMFTVGGRRGEIVSSMFGRSFYYSSLSAAEYEEAVQSAGCRLLFSEIDDPSGGGHRVVCCQKANV